MESPFYEMTHDYAYENQISTSSYNAGYTQGLLDGQRKLTEQLAAMSDEDLVQWHNCIRFRHVVFDELLNEMNTNYQSRQEKMKHEIKQLEREIEEEKARIGEDAYNQKILSVLTAENNSSNQK